MPEYCLRHVRTMFFQFFILINCDFIVLFTGLLLNKHRLTDHCKLDGFVNKLKKKRKEKNVKIW